MTFSIQSVDTEAVACIQRRSWSFYWKNSHAKAHFEQNVLKFRRKSTENFVFEKMGSKYKIWLKKIMRFWPRRWSRPLLASLTSLQIRPVLQLEGPETTKIKRCRWSVTDNCPTQLKSDGTSRRTVAVMSEVYSNDWHEQNVMH